MVGPRGTIDPHQLAVEGVRSVRFEDKFELCEVSDSVIIQGKENFMHFPSIFFFSSNNGGAPCQGDEARGMVCHRDVSEI